MTSKFNGKMYIQKQGTAMGTRMAPNYAIIFMHYLETNMLNKSTLKPKAWLRFIDDIFMIWSHGIQALTLFYGHAKHSSSHHKNYL